MTIYDAETDLLIGEAAQEGDVWVLRCREGDYSVPVVSAPTFEGLIASIDDYQRIGPFLKVYRHSEPSGIRAVMPPPSEA